MSAHPHHETRAWTRARRSTAWPQLARTAAPYLAVPALLIAIGLVNWRLGAFLGAAAIAVGMSRGFIWLVRRSRERAQADRWIRGHRYVHPASDLVSQRIAELTAPRTRRMLAASLRGAGKKARTHGLLSASPLNVVAARSEAGLIEQLAHRLADLERPVNARGVLLARDLLTHGGSPLYGRASGQELGAALLSILTALEATR